MTNNLINKSVDIIKKKGTLSFIGKLNRRIIRDIIGPIIVSIIGLFFVPSIIKKLKRATNKEDTLDDSVNIAFNFKVNRFNFAPSQIREEILELLKVLEKLNPKISLEIGTAGGGDLISIYSNYGQERVDYKY